MDAEHNNSIQNGNAKKGSTHRRRIWEGLAGIGVVIAALATLGHILGGLSGYVGAYHAITDIFAPHKSKAPIDEKRAAPPPIPADKVSIIVLPFKNLSDDRKQAYFADALTSSIKNGLSASREHSSSLLPQRSHSKIKA